jgi:uncharacterized RDD family membrane protein YckC
MKPTERLFRAPFALTGRAAEAAWSETLQHGTLERAVAEAIRLGTIDRLVDELVAAGLLDRVVEALVERGLVDRIVESVVQRGLIDQVADGMLESGAIARIASSSVVQAAIPTSASMADQVLTALHAASARADDSIGQFASRLLRRRQTDSAQTPAKAAGLVSRLSALFIDATVVGLVGVAVSGAVAIVVNLFGKLDVASFLGVFVAAATSTVAIVAYFSLSWTLVGQTIGMRVLAVRVLGHDGRPPRFARSLLLVFATALSVALLFAGYLPILWEPKRVALQDYLTRTRVLYTTDLE